MTHSEGGFAAMAIERTLSIIKPDATERNLTGQIVARLEAAGLRVIAQKRIWWRRKDAKDFYAIHKGQPYYKDLLTFMTSGPVLIQVLEGENAIQKNRNLMGATDPKKAEAGTIRADFAQNIEANAVPMSEGTHCFDPPASATRSTTSERTCFFSSRMISISSADPHGLLNVAYQTPFGNTLCW